MCSLEVFEMEMLDKKQIKHNCKSKNSYNYSYVFQIDFYGISMLENPIESDWSFPDESDFF